MAEVLRIRSAVLTPRVAPGTHGTAWRRAGFPVRNGHSALRWSSLSGSEHPGQFAIQLLHREFRWIPPFHWPLLQVREAFVARIAGGFDLLGEAPPARVFDRIGSCAVGTTWVTGTKLRRTDLHHFAEVLPAVTVVVRVSEPRAHARHKIAERGNLRPGGDLGQVWRRFPLLQAFVERAMLAGGRSRINLESCSGPRRCQAAPANLPPKRRDERAAGRRKSRGAPQD